MDEDKYGLRCMSMRINVRTQMTIRCAKDARNGNNDNYGKLYGDDDDGSGIT